MAKSSFTWGGDFVTCNFWRPFAEDRQRMLDQTVGMRSLHEEKGIGVGGKALTRTLSQVYFPVSGVEIMIQVYPHHIHIKAEGVKLYLESGFYEFDYFNPYEEIPPETGATVHYTYPVNELLLKRCDGKPSPDQGKTWVYSSKMLECILSGEDLQSGWRSRSFVYKDAPDKGSFINKSKLMYRVSPSSFSGKLSLLIQAHYGSESYDLRYVEGLEGVLTITPDIVLVQWGTEIMCADGKYLAHTGLFTYEPPEGSTFGREYWLMQVGGATIRFIKLELDKSTQSLRDAIDERKFDDNNPITTSVKTRAEAYVLANTALPAATWPHEVTEETGLTSVIVDIDLPTGFILYYGWHWNWEGTQADAIFHEWQRGEGPDGSDIWVAKHVHLDVTYNPENVYSPFSVEISVKSQKQWYPHRAMFALLIPAYNVEMGPNLKNTFYDEFFISNSLEPPESTPDPHFNFSNVPLYCYRDELDGFHLVTISDDLEYRTDTENLTSGWVFAPDVYWESGTTYSGYNGTTNVSAGAYSKTLEFENIVAESITTQNLKGDPAWSVQPSRDITASRRDDPHEGYVDYAQYMCATGYIMPSDCPDGGNLTGGWTDTCYTAEGSATTCDITYGANRAYYAFSILNDYITVTTESWPNGKAVSGDITIVVPYDSCKGVLIADKATIGDNTKNTKFWDIWSSRSAPLEYRVETAYYNQSTGKTVYLRDDVDRLDKMYAKLYGLIVADPTEESTVFNPEHWEGGMAVVTSGVKHYADNDTDVYDYFTWSLLDFYVGSSDSLEQSISGGWRAISQYFIDSVAENYIKSTSVGWA